MQNHIDSNSTPMVGKVVPFPVEIVGIQKRIADGDTEESDVETPKYDELVQEAETLDRVSRYKSEFDYRIYRNLERRFSKQPIRGGIVKNNPMKLVNAHSTCQQCLYAFEIDTYGRGCSHNCTYCYAKAQLTVHGYWNNPTPVPVDINEIRRTFYEVFESTKKNKWRAVLERRIPLRIGCMSDSFMWIDAKYKVTQELLKILSFYDYPYTIITHSDLIGHDDYLALLRKDLCSVQFSIPSVNDELNKKLEPGAPSAKRRLAALKKVSNAGIWNIVRINPMFPIFPDGYFTNPDFSWEGPVPQFEYSSFDMIDSISAAGCKCVIAGFGRFSAFSMNNISRATGVDLHQFFNREVAGKSRRDYHFSEREIRYYYEELKRRCDRSGVDFTICYIGNGEGQFWAHQDLWSNKKDCCNIKGRVSGCVRDSREIPFELRTKFMSTKDAVPVDEKTLHKELGEESEARKRT